MEADTSGDWDRIAAVTRSVTLPAPVLDVWAVIGDFHAMDRWHPGVRRSTREHVGDDEFRALELVGGGRLLEHLEDKGRHHYDYAILRGPLPVAHYHARLGVSDTGQGTKVTWSSSFTPRAPGAEDAVAAIYEAGFEALRERFGG